MSRRRVLLVSAGLTFALAADASPMLHERIAPDPRDDLAMGVVLDGDLPAAIETPSGLVSAPDPRRPVGAPPPRRGSAGGTFDAATAGAFEPDTDTRRPDLLPYDEPFTPSTAPFKRLVAFDAVDAAFRLVVSDPTLRPLPVGEARAATGPEDSFYADVVVGPPSPRAAGSLGRPRAADLVRIPSVGPGAHVLHARLGSGARDIGFRIWRDGADNWFVESGEAGRLVMQQSIPRAALGGEPGDPLPGELLLPAQPPEVVRDAGVVAAAIGLDRSSTRRAIAGLVAYFRSFVDSDDPPRGHGNVYLDLALSRKGVCRHRAYAFTVTALGLGIPARMVLNEAHAWVEVHDGVLWRRIDLGGAGRTLDAPRDPNVLPYLPPADPYEWPPDAESGEDLGRFGQAPSPSPSGASPVAPPAPSGAASSSSLAPAPSDTAWSPGAPTTPGEPSARVALEVTATDARRGAPLDVRGEVTSGGDACGHVTVEVALRDPATGRARPVGSLATDDAGKFSGALIVPSDVRAGDYAVIARTSASARCAAGASE